MNYLNDFTLKAPKELSLQIIQFLDEGSLVQFSSVCSSWKKIAESAFEKLFVNKFKELLVAVPDQKLETWRSKFLFFNCGVIKLTKKAWATKKIDVFQLEYFKWIPSGNPVEPLVGELRSAMDFHRGEGINDYFLTCGYRCRSVQVAYQLKDVVSSKDFPTIDKRVVHAVYGGENHFLILQDYDPKLSTLEQNTYYLGSFSPSTNQLDIILELEGKTWNEKPLCITCNKDLVVISTDDGKIMGWKIHALKENKHEPAFSYHITNKSIRWIEIFADRNDFKFLAFGCGFLFKGEEFSPNSVVKKYPFEITLGVTPISIGSHLFWCKDHVDGGFISMDFSEDDLQEEVPQWFKAFFCEDKILVQEKLEEKSYKFYLCNEAKEVLTDEIFSKEPIVSASFSRNFVALAYHSDEIKIYQFALQKLKEVYSYTPEFMHREKYKTNDCGITKISLTAGLILCVGTRRGEFIIHAPQIFGKEAF